MSRKGGECSLICRPQKFLPVFNGHDRVSRVYVVEVILGLKPGAFYIIDHESDVGRYPLWLNWAQINAENICAGVFIAHYINQ